MRQQRLICLFAAAIGVMMAADSPFIGKWKLNTAKSQFAGTTETFEKLPSGEMQLTAGGETHKFQIDGKEYPGSFGSTVAWKQLDPNTWEVTTKMGSMITTTTVKISADGKTMTETSVGKKPNGETATENTTSERVSGGPGLVGKWKASKVQSSTEMWEISANGEDGLTVKIVDYNAVCSVKFDQKDYPCSGPTMPKDFMMSAQKTGPRSILFTEKMGGKAMSTDLFTVSADGKTITDVGTTLSTSEKMKAVYDRQ